MDSTVIVRMPPPVGRLCWLLGNFGAVLRVSLAADGSVAFCTFATREQAQHALSSAGRALATNGFPDAVIERHQPHAASYVAAALRPEERAGYRAGGVLAYRWRPNPSPAPCALEVLLGLEMRKKEQARVLTFCAGKREAIDIDALHCAAREFAEETGCVLEGDLDSGVEALADALRAAMAANEDGNDVVAARAAARGELKDAGGDGNTFTAPPDDVLAERIGNLVLSDHAAAVPDATSTVAAAARSSAVIYLAPAKMAMLVCPYDVLHEPLTRCGGVVELEAANCAPDGASASDTRRSDDSWPQRHLAAVRRLRPVAMESLHWVGADALLAATEGGRPGARLTVLDAEGTELQLGRFLAEVLREREVRQHLTQLAAAGSSNGTRLYPSTIGRCTHLI
jgi:hypothetical protein